jgi:transposase-like protein DUF772
MCGLRRLVNCQKVTGSGGKACNLRSAVPGLERIRFPALAGLQRGWTMKPNKLERSDTDDLFRTRLENIINLRHGLVRLTHETDWGFFEKAIEPLYAEAGRPGVPVRFMVGLHILKHTFNLSDEEVCAQWVENPYFQYFTGEDFRRTW